MKRPSIKGSLVAIFAVVALIFLGFAGFAMNRMSSLNDGTREITTNWMPSAQISSQIALDAAGLRLIIRDHVIAEDPAVMADIAKALDAQIEVTRRDITSYEAVIASEKERGLYTKVKTAVGDYISALPKALQLSAAGQNAAVRAYLQELTPVTDRIVDTTRDLLEFNNQGGQAATEAGQANFELSRLISLAMSVSILMLLGGATAFAMMGISKPIMVITQSMTTLASGDTAKEIPFNGRADEIGSMAAAVEVFRQTALAKMESDRLIEANRSQSEKDRMAQEAADRARAEAMAQATTGLASGLRSLSAGDLTVQISESFAADFESLRADFNAAVGQLSKTLRAVADATGAIDNGSREVSASADDLSKRTEQQAASLEETAAALDEITVNVANSSKRADEARKIAVLANESAAQSGKVVADAVDAMHKIEQSSNEISNIIGVIDEIAFQTNLLALNAGVEAARAGEAGKGFAVVAQEVRELAQRSAKAAKEIKDLIRNSSLEVQNGVRLVSATGEELKTIESYIVTVNQHMDSIATSAREQSVGLSEVNTAVNQMDQVTQQNAAMVEETSAAGASLATESGRLRELISQFQLGGALRQTAAVMAAGAAHRPVASPVRKLAAKVATAFSGNAAVSEAWEDF
ncbi:methyl-accepting chemotaxis protein [Rhizobium sp. Leaf341]|uniref:methyl-accepting chemotaxis protein n=1 Tax=Rhizobium sp. Leaf341 TaxID=1736344 RepID=UPI0007162590|nr:methyl-accepting chemotaxis protein [Rhizobium sp. Leaf341]KQR75897.1 chemotaxis protein [Rhizobium sp. Leaf341]